MANNKAWLDVLLVVQEDEFFTRSKHGTIWGTVYFQIGENEFFPGQGWTSGPTHKNKQRDRLWIWPI